MPRVTKADIARELGISHTAVGKLCQRGMPSDDVDAARRWRVENLQQGRMKADPGPSPSTLLLRAQRLAEFAHVAVQKGQFALVSRDLRTAMRLVPESHRPQLRMSDELWLALLGQLAVSILDAGRQPGDGAVLDGLDGTQESEDDVGRILYAIASGEARLA